MNQHLEILEKFLKEDDTRLGRAIRWAMANSIRYEKLRREHQLGETNCGWGHFSKGEFVWDMTQLSEIADNLP